MLHKVFEMTRGRLFALRSSSSTKYTTLLSDKYAIYHEEFLLRSDRDRVEGQQDL